MPYMIEKGDIFTFFKFLDANKQNLDENVDNDIVDEKKKWLNMQVFHKTFDCWSKYLQQMKRYWKLLICHIKKEIDC